MALGATDCGRVGYDAVALPADPAAKSSDAGELDAPAEPSVDADTLDAGRRDAAASSDAPLPLDEVDAGNGAATDVAGDASTTADVDEAPSDATLGDAADVALPPTTDFSKLSVQLICFAALSSGQNVTVFGTVNQLTDRAISVPVGPRNSLSPAPQDRGQPVLFPPGRFLPAFVLRHVESVLVWGLAGRTATSSQGGPACKLVMTGAVTQIDLGNGLLVDVPPS